MWSIKNIWRQISDIGVYQDTDSQVKKNAQLINMICAGCFAMLFAFVPINIYLRLVYFDYDLRFLYIVGMGMLMMLLPIYMNYRHMYLLSKHASLSMTILITGLLCLVTTIKSGTLVYFSVVFMLPLILFEAPKTIHRYQLSIVAIVLVFGVYYHFLKVPIFAQSQRVSEIFFTINFISAFVLFLIMLLSFKKTNQTFQTQIVEANQLIEKKNTDLMHSIKYAQRIQAAVLGRPEHLANLFPKSFVLFRPRDIVSGDFYWFSEHHPFKIIIAADCTGHGVPGAFMTMLAHSLLNEIVLNMQTLVPSFILQNLDIQIQAALHQDEGGMPPDGLDISVIVIDQAQKEFFYSGAKNPAFLIRNKILEKMPPSKSSVGGKQLKGKKEFEAHYVRYRPGDRIYLFSDGFQDQFGGENDTKYMSKRFRELIQSYVPIDISKQKALLEKELSDWQGKKPQTDDILVLGIEF